MMKTTDARKGNQLRSVRLRLHRAAARRILAQRVMRAVQVVIRHEFAGQAPDMRFVERDHMIEAIPARRP